MKLKLGNLYTEISKAVKLKIVPIVAEPRGWYNKPFYDLKALQNSSNKIADALSIQIKILIFRLTSTFLNNNQKMT